MSSSGGILIAEQNFAGDDLNMVQIAQFQWQKCTRDCLEHLDKGITQEISRSIRDALQDSSAATLEAFSKIEANHKKIVGSLRSRIYELENSILSMQESSSASAVKSIEDSLFVIESSCDAVSINTSTTPAEDAETIANFSTPLASISQESIALSDLVQKTIINSVCFQTSFDSSNDREMKKIQSPKNHNQSLASYFEMVLREKDIVIERLNSQIESLSRENVNLESELQIQRRTTVPIEIHSYSKARIIELEGTLEKSQLDLRAIRNDLATLGNELNAKDSEFADLKKEAKALQEELDELKRNGSNSGHGVHGTSQDDPIGYRLDHLFDCQPMHPLILNENLQELEKTIVTTSELQEAREVIATTTRDLHDLKMKHAITVKQLKNVTDEKKAAIADMEVAVFQNSILSQQLADALVSQRRGVFTQLPKRESRIGAGDASSDVRSPTSCGNNNTESIGITFSQSSTNKREMHIDNCSQFSSEGRKLLLLSGKKRIIAAPHGIVKPITASVSFSEMTAKVLSTVKDTSSAVGVLTSKSVKGEFLGADSVLAQNTANITLFSNEEPCLYLGSKRVSGVKTTRREFESAPSHGEYLLETSIDDGSSSYLSNASEGAAIDISQLSVQDVYVLIQRNTSLVAMLATYVHAIDIIKTEVLNIHKVARKSASSDKDVCKGDKGDTSYIPNECFFGEYEKVLKAWAPSINRLIDQQGPMSIPIMAKRHRGECSTNTCAKTQTEKWSEDYAFMTKLNIPFVAEYTTLKNALYNLLGDDLDKPLIEEEGTSTPALFGVHATQPETIVVDNMESDIVSSISEKNESCFEQEDESIDIIRTALGLKVQETCTALKAKVDRHANLILDVSSAWSKICSPQKIADSDDEEDESGSASVMQLMNDSLKETTRCYAKTALEQHVVMVELREALTKEKEYSHQLEEELNVARCGREFMKAIDDYKTFIEQYVVSDKLRLTSGPHGKYSSSMAKVAGTSDVIQRGSDVCSQSVQVWEHIELILQKSLSRETTTLELLKARQEQRNSTTALTTCPAVEQSLRASIEELQLDAERFRVMYENLAHHHSIWMDKVWTSEQQVEEYKILAAQAQSTMVPNEVHANVLIRLEEALNLNKSTQDTVDALRITLSEKDAEHAKIFIKYNDITDQMKANDAAHRKYEEYIQYEIQQKNQEIMDKNKTISQLEGIQYANTAEIGNLRNSIIEEQNKVGVLEQALNELQTQALTEPLVKIIFPTAADVIEATNVTMKELREQVQQYRTTIYEQEMELQRLQLACLASENDYKSESCHRQELSLEISCCKEQLRTIEERTNEAMTSLEVRLAEATRSGQMWRQERDNSLLREEVLKEQIEVLSSDHTTANVRRYGVAKTKELQSQIEEVSGWLQVTKEELRQRTNELEDERKKSQQAMDRFEEESKAQHIKIDDLVSKAAILETDLQRLYQSHNELNEKFESEEKRLNTEIKSCKCENESLVTKQSEATQKIMTLLAEINSLSSLNTELCSTVRRFEVSDRQAKATVATLQKELLTCKKEASDMRASSATLAGGAAATTSLGRFLRPQALRRI